jgi:hypothetical protein
MFCQKYEVLDYRVGCQFIKDRKCVVIKLRPIHLICRGHLSALVTAWTAVGRSCSLTPPSAEIKNE